jgi:HAMP domain-containing protein
MDLIGNVNVMNSNLANQLREISQVAVSAAQGDYTMKVTGDMNGELADLKNAINSMM